MILQRSGSVRGEDVPFFLGLPVSPLFPYNYTRQDIEITRIMVQYISNFVQVGLVTIILFNFKFFLNKILILK